jgi:hypothetical protein
VVGKRIFFGKESTIALEIISVDPTAIHPEAQALIADELDNANGFIKSSILRLSAIQLVLVNQHALLLRSASFNRFNSSSASRSMTLTILVLVKAAIKRNLLKVCAQMRVVLYVSMPVFYYKQTFFSIGFPSSSAPNKERSFVPWIHHRG